MVRPERLLFTVQETAIVLSVSRTRVYELMASGRLNSVKLGRARRVSMTSIRRLVEGESVA
jgi:excisionase family DNA binding protein